jgi:prevent-host-death family protein
MYRNQIAQIYMRLVMIRISATRFRNRLFDFLDQAAAGETIVIERNHQEVARLVPA